MTYQDKRNKGGRPKAIKGKARTKTIIHKAYARRVESGHETDNRCREEAVTLPARTVTVRQGRGGKDTGGQAADKDAGGRVQQPEPVGEDGTSARLPRNEKQNHGFAGRVQQNHHEDMMGDLKKRGEFRPTGELRE